MAFAVTHRTNRTAAEAVAFVTEQARERSTSWQRLCLGLCARAYGFEASGTPNVDHDQFVEASDYWKSAHHRHPGDRRPPVGALACWTKAGHAGHIAVVVHSHGDDVRIASNDIDGVVAVVALGYIETHWGLAYRGWVEPDFPHGIDMNPAPRPRPRKLTEVWWQRLAFGVTRSDSVRALQRRLNVTVKAGLEITGAYDQQTRAAVAKFQRRQGWTAGDADGLIYDPARHEGGRVTTQLLFPQNRFEIHWTDPGTRVPVPQDGKKTPKRGGQQRKQSGPKRPRTLSALGARMIGEFEGFRAKLYNDPAGHCTIGYGHLVHYGPTNGSEPEKFRKGITRAEGRRLLREDARPAGEAVNSLVKIPLSQQQFDALTSFVYNLGSGSLASSQLLKRLNAGEYHAVPEELDKWVHAGGQVLPGLVKRRRDEGVLFTSGAYPWQRQPTPR
jgi:lysozyme